MLAVLSAGACEGCGGVEWDGEVCLSWLVCAFVWGLGGWKHIVVRDVGYIKRVF